MRALLIGNSDGIGLATTRALLERGWNVIGISRRPSPLTSPAYQHHVADVGEPAFEKKLRELASEQLDLCIHCVGIGELLDIDQDLRDEARTFDINLISMVKTVASLLPAMIKRGEGHMIGLSSQADTLLSPQAPAYSASKAGYSSYLESLALAVKARGVHITNVRFGFVDTKMAKGDKRPLMMPVERAVSHVLRCIRRRPMRYTAPKLLVPLLELRKWMLRFCLLISKACR